MSRHRSSGTFCAFAFLALVHATLGLASAANPIRGGLLWDRWWKVNGAPQPSGTHPLYPSGGPQSGGTTFRCKECHGWDYKGVDGAYGTPGGSHYTGISGVFGTTLATSELKDIIKTTSVPNGHGFQAYGLSDTDIDDLVAFIETSMIDTDLYVDAQGAFLGDPVQGKINYDVLGSCGVCHGSEGTGINFGTPVDPEWVGTIAADNPWELLHKIRFGNPGTSMPSWIAGGGGDQGAADIGAYAQQEQPTTSLCTPAPRASCVESSRAAILIKRSTNPARAKLKLVWRGATAVAPTDFGTPDSTTNYALCLYDTNASLVAAGPSIDLRPDAAWSPKLPDGWSYLDKQRTFAGIRKVRLIAGAPGKSQVIVSGHGSGLPLPAPVTPTRLFAQDPTVTVQLVNENARCWSATFSSAGRNTGRTFRARRP